jgi:catechol 2,3-dioxygenase-like lactoylglutathione lyase family enzyme
MTQPKFASARSALQRIALVALAASLTACAAAQATPAAMPAPAATAAAPTQTPPFNGIAHIAIRVQSIAASLAFYNKLGYQQAFANTGRDGSVSQSFVKINDKQFIELYPAVPPNPARPQSAAQSTSSFLHLCLEAADINATHDFYAAEGLAPRAVETAGAGNLLFTIRGPQQPTFAQNIEYTQYMPTSRHMLDIGQHLSPDRVADKMTVVTLAMQDPAAARDFYLTKLGFTRQLRPDGRDRSRRSAGLEVQHRPHHPQPRQGRGAAYSATGCIQASNFHHNRRQRQDAQ